MYVYFYKIIELIKINDIFSLAWIGTQLKLNNNQILMDQFV